MMFQTHTLVGFLSDSSFELVGKGIEKGEVLTFPKGLIKKVGITDRNLYKQLFLEFIAKLGLRGQKVLLVLGDSIVFQEKIPLTDKVKDEANDFYKKIPLDNDDMVKQSLSNDKEVFLFATNRQLY